MRREREKRERVREIVRERGERSQLQHGHDMIEEAEGYAL